MASKIPIQGSERLALVGSHAVGPINPNQHIEVTIRLRQAGSDGLNQEYKKWQISYLLSVITSQLKS